MKRKLIKQGGGGYTIYLPKKWVDAKGLVSKSEINIEEKEDKLVLSTDSTIKKSCSINVGENHKAFLEKTIIQAYRKGYTEIELKTKSEINNVLKIVKQLIGMKLISKSENNYLLEIYNTDEKYGAKKILIKAFQGAIMIFDELKKGLEPEQLILLQSEYESNCNYYRRIIKINDSSNEFAQFTIRTLNLLTNKIRYLSKKWLKTNKPKKDVLDGFEKVNQHLRTMLKGIASDSIDIISSIGSEKKNNEEFAEKIILEKDVQAIYGAYLLETFRLLYGLYSMIVGYMISEKL